MKKIVMIKMQGCPYCEQAYKAIDELKAENDESRVPRFSGSYCRGHQDAHEHDRQNL